MISTIWQPCWKLTDTDHTTYGGCQWGKNIENPSGVRSGQGGLCSGGFYHAYDNAYTAMLMNPSHANFPKPVLWQAEWRGVREEDNGLKFGATELRMVRIVKAPVVTTNQYVAFAIFCAAQVWDEEKCPAWHEWAAKWLTGEDRSSGAANAASAAASAASGAANVASSAANAADAAYTAYNTDSYAAAYAAANAAICAASYASHASYAAASAADVSESAWAWALTIDEIGL